VTGAFAESAALAGRHGTVIARAPTLAEPFGVGNAMEIGIAAARFGFVAGGIRRILRSWTGRHPDGGYQGARRPSARPARVSARRCLFRRHRKCCDDSGVRDLARAIIVPRSRLGRRSRGRRSLATRCRGWHCPGIGTAPEGNSRVPPGAQHPFHRAEKTARKGFPSLGIAL